MKPRFTSMTVGLAAGITAAVALACGAGAYVYSVHHFQSLLDTARATALAEGDLIRVALEHQMIENDRSLIVKMIDSFGRQPRVEGVVLLDRIGTLRYASGRLAAETDLSMGSATCQSCHRLPPEQRGTSRVSRREAARCSGPWYPSGTARHATRATTRATGSTAS